MRTVTFIFALSFLTTLGWKVHSTLTDWTTPTRVDLSSISKAIRIVESQSINQKENELQISEENFFAKIEKQIDQQIKITKVKIAKKNAILKNKNKLASYKIDNIKFKSEKQKFGLPENKFENIKYSINYHESEYHYVAFEFNPALKLDNKVVVAEKIVEQEVKTIAAKSIEAKNEQQYTDKELGDEFEEDIKIFEYSKNEPVEKVGSIEPAPVAEINPLMSTQKADLSVNVAKAIQREMGQTPINQVVKPKININIDGDTGSMGPLALNASVQNSNPLKDDGKKTENNFVSTHEISLQAGGVDFTSREMSIQNYEMIPFDDENEITSSDSEGLLKLKIAEGQTRLVSFRSEGYLTTNMKVNSDSADSIVPMLEKEEFEKLLNKFRLHGEGSFLLVQLDDEIKNIELDKPSEAKLFLDKDFKIAAKENNPQFVLFIGVAPGNTMIGYDFSKDNKKINKIVYLTEDELYFENEGFDRKPNYNFSLYTKELMGNGKTALNVNSEAIASFNDNQESKKLTLNSYGFKDIISAKNEANYFELRLPDHNLFFTASNGDEIELPSKTYLNEILAQFNLNSLKESCVIQINMDNGKKLEQLKFNGRSYQGFENVELLALDNDGSLGSEVTDTTKKVFLSGNAQGVINLKFKYTDETFDYHQTYCSPGIYLVEHL